jgi:hypothetical protein
MQIKCLFLTALLLAVTTVGSAQAKKSTAKTTKTTPEQVVKNLYVAQKNQKTNPFDQTSRVLADKYFTKELADLIWKTSNVPDSNWRNIDVLYNSHELIRDTQDRQITNFVVGKPKEESGPDDVFLKVTFQSSGEAEVVVFNLRREANKIWKIDNIQYSNGDDLASIIRYAKDAKYRKEYNADTFLGDYMVGAMKCSVERTISRIELYRVFCDRQFFKLYAVEGSETETAYIYTDDKGKQQGRFVFKNGKKDGKYFDASGKEVKVTRMK